MQKLYSLYRLMACLSIFLFWTGQAAAPAEPTDPPTPAQEAYADWTDRRPPEAGSRLPERSEPSAEMLADCFTKPAKDDWTGLAYSGLSYGTNWNEDIYYRWGACGSGSGSRLNTDPGSDFEPRLNRDATSIVFVSTRNSTSKATYTNIYSISTIGADQRRLTYTQAQDRTPAFSPDQTKIVFASDRTGSAEIFTMNSDGGSQVALTSAPEADVEPDWSPDGQHIAWVRRMANNTGVLYVMDQDGSDPQAILAPLPYAGQPRWSPGGSQLAFRLDANADGWYDLATVNADGSGLTVLPLPKPAGPTSDLEMGGWLPDGSGLVYNEIHYGWYDTKWLIDSTAINRVEISNPLVISQLSSFPYTFTPHVRSMDEDAPVSTITPLPEFSPAGHVVLNWSISDNFSNPFSYSLQASSDQNLDWQRLDGGEFMYFNSPQTGTWVYAGQPGTTASFRLQAVDRANNTEALKTVPDAWTRLYQWFGQSRITDARGHLLSGVHILSNPLAMNQPLSARDGQATLYFPVTGRYNVNYSKTGYMASTPQKWNMDANQKFLAVLTGPAEQLENGHFDNSQTPLAGWLAAESLESGLASGRYDGQSARLGKVCADVFCLGSPTLVGQPNPDFQGATMAINEQDTVHVRYQSNHFATIDENGVLQPWPDLPLTSFFGTIKFDPDGTPYLIEGSQLIHWNGSAWSSETMPMWTGSFVEYEMDNQGRLHILYMDYLSNGVLRYIRRDVDGTWRIPIIVSNQYTQSADLAIDSEDNMHIVLGNSSTMSYVQIHPDGTATDPELLGQANNNEDIFLQFIPGRGLVMVASNQHEWLAMQRSTNGSWTHFFLESSRGWVQQMRKDAAGNIYVLAENREEISNALLDERYSILSTGDDHFHTYMIPNELADNTSFDVDSQGRPHFLYAVNINWQTAFEYRRGTQEALPASVALDQTISLDQAIDAPTLSFFYRVASPNPDPASRLVATYTPSGGQPAILFSQTAITCGWTHAWADLTPSLGQTGALSFSLEQSAGEFPALVYLDEASVSTWPTPLLSYLNPTRLDFPLPQGSFVDIYGENLQLNAQVYFGGAPASAVEWIDSSHLRFLAPEIPSVGFYPVRVVNPGGAENELTLMVGNFTFLPTLMR